MGLPKGRTNNPFGIPQRTPAQVEAYILSKRLINSNGCWEWVGKVNMWGYAQIHWQHRHTLVHRVAAVLWMGFDLADERKVLHHCDNPKCFNPGHLYIGTDADNSRDCTDRGRQYQQRKTHCANGHEFTPDNTHFKKNIGKTGVGYERVCRTCHRIQEHIRYQRRAKCA